jgi:hypothetical protein
MAHKPGKLLCLENIVGTVCLTFCTWVVVSMFGVQQAVALLNKDQVTNNAVNAQVFRMNDTLIRIDETVKYIREDQVRTPHLPTHRGI